jgi:hypothetical protein
MGVIAINDHVRTSGQSHKVTHHTQNNDSPTAGWFFPSGCPLFAVCILPPLFAAGSKNLPGMALAAVFVASLGAWGGELPANEAIVGVIRVQALSSTLVRVRISPHPFFFLFSFACCIPFLSSPTCCCWLPIPSFEPACFRSPQHITDRFSFSSLVWNHAIVSLVGTASGVHLIISVRCAYGMWTHTFARTR